MNLREQTAQALGRVTQTPHTLQVGATGSGTTGNAQVTCELTALDSLGCGFSHLELSTGAFSSATADQLKTVSEDLSRRLTYLLEPISPIEIDSEGCVVQMRSNPPQRDDDGTSYYELLVRRRGLSLKRWRRAPGAQGRTPLEAQVTREVLLRLVSDFQAVAEAE